MSTKISINILEATEDNVIVRLFVSSILYSVSWKTLSVDMHFSFSVSSGERLNSTEMYWLGMAFSVIHWWLTWLLIQYLIGKNDILKACLLKTELQHPDCAQNEISF